MGKKNQIYVSLKLGGVIMGMPEEDLSHELRKQEQEIHGNLFMLNELFNLCCDATLRIEQIREKSEPIITKLEKSNPIVAKEIREVLAAGDQAKAQAYFEQEKDQLIQTLSNELKQHKGIGTKINHEKSSQYPTDS